ncbi:MAG: type VI secretion system contractile sheath small subunit [Sandaracinaceae bacterium]
MAGEIEDRGAAQVHWLVVGEFGLGEPGRTLHLTRADFNEALEKAGLTVSASVPDIVGDGEAKSITMKIGSLKDLTLKNVFKAVPELAELAGKADQIAKIKDPTTDDLERLFGKGALYDALATELEPPAEAASADAGEVTGDTDTILSKAEVQKPTAKSAIDMFVRATSSSRKKASKPSSRKLRDLAEAAIWGLASSVLRSEEVRKIENGWRGLRFLLTQCPKDAGMEVILLEATPETVLEQLGKRDRGEDIDEPDCIFVPHEFATTSGLSELADFAEQELIPIVVGATPTLYGTEDPQAVPGQFEALEAANNTDLPEWATAWDELRMVEATRWLCAVTNPIALYTEGKGTAERVVFGSPVWGIAAMLAASYKNSGGFARIFGKAGSLSAPASHTLPKGRYSDTAAPTEAFYPIASAELLSKNGVLGVGAARNSDTLALLKAPMVRGAKDAVPLPAQILTGRVVRFATWVKSQLPEGCNSATANDIFMSAASVFLFPGQETAAHVRAAVTNIEGEAHVMVRAKANPAVASVPFEIVFPMPLHWSVPAPEDDGPSEAAGPSAGEAAEVKAEATGDKPEGSVGMAGGSVGFDVGLDDK